MIPYFQIDNLSWPDLSGLGIMVAVVFWPPAVSAQMASDEDKIPSDLGSFVLGDPRRVFVYRCSCFYTPQLYLQDPLEFFKIGMEDYP